MHRLIAAVLLSIGCIAVADAGVAMPSRGSVEVAFAPHDDAEQAIVGVIDDARREVLVQIYIFTSRPIARALLRAAARGVRVAVLADGNMHKRPKGNALPMLIDGGIQVALETEFAAAHNKVLIVDAGGARPTVVTGSYNFTWSARHKNAENLLILRDNAELARAYADNWHRHRRLARPVASPAALRQGG
ncbi:MAG: phospholipase D family protein [Rhodocyclaceae bacterium]|nr:phospholipase D family protein [Rhodocyclaceae bacterium]